MPSLAKRDTATEYPARSPPPASVASTALLPYVPPPAPILPWAGPRPARVKIWTTPVTASEPYSTLTGPRTTSIRSTLSVVRLAKSYVPKPGSFCGTPSIKTFT